MNGHQGSQFVGSIIGALVACLFSLFTGDHLLVVVLITFIGWAVGAAVGYAAWMVARS